jgi:hypothetical protein
MAGKTWISGRDTAQDALDESNLVACIPLNLGGEVTGAIAVFSLLSHKAGFEDLDYELFDLLATHAGTALYCTELHATRGAGEAD